MSLGGALFSFPGAKVLEGKRNYSEDPLCGFPRVTPSSVSGGCFSLLQQYTAREAGRERTDRMVWSVASSTWSARVLTVPEASAAVGSS